MESELSTRQLQWLRPAPQLCDPLDMDVFARRIDVFVDCDQRRPHDMQTGQPRARSVGQHAGSRFKQRVPQLVESRPQVDCHENDRGKPWRLGRAVADHAHGLGKAQSPAKQRPETAPLLALAALGQRHEIEMAEIEGQFLRRAVSIVGHRLKAFQDDLLQRWRHLGAKSSRRNGIEPGAVADLSNTCRAAEWQLAACHLIHDRTKRKQIAALVGANPQ